MSEATTYSTNLADCVKSHIDVYGAIYVEEISLHTTMLRAWIRYLDAYEKTGCADVLLDGVSSAIFEVAACTAAGFARVALGSIRAQIDLVLSWLYFKDHPVEWERLEQQGYGFMQKAELMKYLSESLCRSFGARWGVLKQCKTRSIEEPFSVLSAHLHRQRGGTVVSIQSCSSVVCKKQVCDEVVVLQSCTSEYLNDVLLTCYSEKWAALPDEIVVSARARLTGAQEAVLFS